MSDAATASTATTDAIPRHCARCDYPLAGLPGEGVCPECGTAYDGRFVILRGRAVGASATIDSAGPIRATALAIFSMSGLWLQQLFGLSISVAFGHARLLAINIALIALALVLIAGTLRRRFSISGPPAQFWLSPNGYVLRGRTERHLVESPAGRATSRAALWLAAIGTVVASVGFLVSHSCWSLLTITFAAIFATFVVLFERERRKPRTEMRLSPVRWPIVFKPWSGIASFRVIPDATRPNRFEVRVERVRDEHAIVSRSTITRVIVELDDAQSHRVVDRVNAWWSSGSNRAAKHE